jgi:hypothetical protein
MPVEIFDCEQGGDDWKALRLGIPTASNFKFLMVKNDTKAGRRTYMHKLAGERLCKEPMENFSSTAMEDGKRAEPILLHDYSFFRNCEPVRIGFARNGKCGASPDGLVEDNGGVEIKRAAPHILIPMLETHRADPKYFPGEHFAQCQGNMMVLEREYWDLVVGYPGMPKPLIVRTMRDENYIKELRDAIDVFDLELRRLVSKLRAA